MYPAGSSLPGFRSSQRVGAYLEREGLLVRDIGNSYLQLEAPDESAMNDLRAHSLALVLTPGTDWNTPIIRS